MQNHPWQKYYFQNHPSVKNIINQTESERYL